MVYFDVESLFTSIPLDECIDLVITHSYQGNPVLKVGATDLKTLFSFATAETHFSFKGVFYEQIDGVAMGPPRAFVLADLGHHEKLLLDNFHASTILFYRWYVDDAFCYFSRSTMPLHFSTIVTQGTLTPDLLYKKWWC